MSKTYSGWKAGNSLPSTLSGESEGNRRFGFRGEGPLINIDYLLLSLKTDNEVPVGSSEICGYISGEYNKRFPKRPQDHDPVDGSSECIKPPIYFYPRVQYKVIRGGPIV